MAIMLQGSWACTESCPHPFHPPESPPGFQGPSGHLFRTDRRRGVPRASLYFCCPNLPGLLLIFCLFRGFLFALKMFSIRVHPCAVFSQLFTILLLPCLSWLGWSLSLQPSDISCLPQGVFFLLRQGYVAHSARCKLLPSFPGASQQQNAALGPLGRPHSLSRRRPPAATPIPSVPPPGGN